MFSHYEECPRCRSRGQDSRGDNLGVYRDGGAHCWACGYHRSGSIIKRWENGGIKEVEHGPKSLLPVDFTREIPADAWKWVMQYGLPYTYWQEIAGYSPSHERFVFQIGGSEKDVTGNLRRVGPMAFSIGRYVGKPREEKSHRKWHVWGDSHRHCEIVLPHGERAGTGTILVEDVVSAHKVAYAGFTTIPLFGTVLHPPVIYHLLSNTEPVVLWLDGDQELQSKRKALALQSILGREVFVKTTKKDPKELTVNQIVESIK